MDHVTRKFDYVLGATCLVALDQITKLFFSSRDFFIGPLHMHLVKNSGLIFSSDFGSVINITLITIGLALFVFFYNKNDLVFWLILSGAISNIIDRLYFSYVRDFIDVGMGFTFNLADAMVVIGLIIILISPAYQRR